MPLKMRLSPKTTMVQTMEDRFGEEAVHRYILIVKTLTFTNNTQPQITEKKKGHPYGCPFLHCKNLFLNQINHYLIVDLRHFH